MSRCIFEWPLLLLGSYLSDLWKSIVLCSKEKNKEFPNAISISSIINPNVMGSLCSDNLHIDDIKDRNDCLVWASTANRIIVLLDSEQLFPAVSKYSGNADAPSTYTRIYQLYQKKNSLLKQKYLFVCY